MCLFLQLQLQSRFSVSTLFDSFADHGGGTDFDVASVVATEAHRRTLDSAPASTDTLQTQSGVHARLRSVSGPCLSLC